MRSIKFIDNFIWVGELLAEGRNRKLKDNAVFVRQGDLDGACAVYSLMMMLMIHKKVNHSDLVNRQQAQKATQGGYNSYMRLQDQFLSGLIGLYKEGYYFKDLASELKSCFKNKATASVVEAFGKKCSSKAKHDMTAKMLETLNAGLPVEVGFSYKKGGGHAVVVVGFTNHRTTLRLFCLDPGFDMPKTGFWNTIIDMQYYEPSNAIYSDFYIGADGVPYEGSVDEILTIDV